MESVEDRIDRANAAMRQQFVREFDCIPGSEAPEGALILEYRGESFAPAWQLAPEGDLWPIWRRVMAALPDDLTPWQKAFWAVSSNEALDGPCPLDLFETGDERLVDAARRACELPVG
ncbi:hypothetical protein [Roseivivax isoporae]|uniref:Antitoxin Xre/MbcA/ParS-like toxin-binding domain-containing protein n=1 Tax=Roseivivax isoporae LMG 25204 TaxID=1449351 RepID=X7F1A3_9RHOB|nr:hypothetical protein [Roseivivax isoporae]ETX26520.1 hypothetical protein RISW2_22975 [Roseivivax isoporae LMG 25204]